MAVSEATKRVLQLPPIYPITDKTLARKKDHIGILKALVHGGARFVQIRDKTTPADEFLEDLERCIDIAAIIDDQGDVFFLCAEKENVTLIVNDRCDIVLSSGAAGVHLGRDDLAPESARSILGNNRIIGFSTHSLAQVREVSSLPIQYIGFGPVFETSTKESASPVVGLQMLKKACEESSLPVVAIGGIRLADVAGVLAAGAHSAAVISALMTAPDIAQRMNDFLTAARER